MRERQVSHELEIIVAIDKVVIELWGYGSRLNQIDELGWPSSWVKIVDQHMG